MQGAGAPSCNTTNLSSRHTALYMMDVNLPLFQYFHSHCKSQTQRERKEKGRWWRTREDEDVGLVSWAVNTDSYQGSIRGNQKLRGRSVRTKERSTLSFSCQLFRGERCAAARSAETVSLSGKHRWTLSDCMFANTVYSLGNPIITFLLPFCLSAILSFWKGPFRDGTILPSPERALNPRLRSSMAENRPARAFSG